MNRHHDPKPFDEEEEIVNPFSDSSQKQRKLADWEAELRKKKMVNIKRREDAIAKCGVKIDDKNWPPVFPIIHHDIAYEILVHCAKAAVSGFRKLVRYSLVSGIQRHRNNGLLDQRLRPLYRAMRTDSALKLVGVSSHTYILSVSHMVHLSSSQIHIGFCIVAAIAPLIYFQGRSLTGVLAAIDVISDSLLVGIYYFIGFGLFCLDSFLNL